MLGELTYKEWVVVAVFYSAVHYVEAALAMEPTIEHTDTSMPNGFGSYHDWREYLVFQLFPLSAWKSYKKLLDQSKTARYLNTQRGQHLTIALEDYFSDQNVRDFLQRDLRNVWQGVGFS